MTGDGDRDGPGDAASGEREDHPGLDVDAAFAAIVAGFADPLPPGAGPWPAAEDLEADAPPSAPDDEDDAAFPDEARLRPTTRAPRHRLPEDSLDPADGGTARSPDRPRATTRRGSSPRRRRRSRRPTWHPGWRGWESSADHSCFCSQR